MTHRRFGGLGRALLAIALLGATASDASAAATRTVSVKNNTSNPIYKLYIWPTELVPRTYSSILTPLKPNDQIDLKVDDIYNSCIFTFRAVFTQPPKRKRPTAVPVKKYVEKSAYKDRVDLCGKKPPLVHFD
ncbi:hypothetical protein GCM10011390_19920 [Aureimonas endophytica]|uniref:Uncharacterized protein n=1 Tax=Aureimonas endophytica TaxID=2027858 RepID=A0A916ZJK2_9HYPH|nr:hypothetical protein [Aureimonas endophytica]GGE01104.1 hypothetical protein GCM10011390_19920 [Aureimonas endophytica]